MSAVVVYAGSGRELEACMEYCRKTRSVLIELSTGLETERLEPDFPLLLVFVFAPPVKNKTKLNYQSDISDTKCAIC
jgi:hypothetical protein